MYFKQLAKSARNVKGCKQPDEESSTSMEKLDHALQKLTTVRMVVDGALLTMEARMMMMTMMEEQDATMYL